MRLFVLFFFLLGCGHNRWAHKPIPWEKPSTEDLSQLEFLSVEESVTEHPSEKRGFVSTPLLYDKPEFKKIEIFYRFIPCHDCKDTKDRRKPVLVIINDGPGRSSNALRSYKAKNKEKDSLFFILKNYHVLIADQRGTGNSSPIDLNDSDLKPELIANHFDSDDIAKDYAQVIKKVLPRRPFFLLGNGYGGLVLYNYMFENSAPKPESFVFANSSTPPYGFLRKYRSQRRLQANLNYKMLRSDPQFKEHILRLREHLQKADLNPQWAHSLYSLLGGSDSEDWKNSTRMTLKKLLKMDSSELEDYFRSLQEGPNLMEYVLFSRGFTPGMTARTLYKYFRKRQPLSSWMLDGFWQKSYLGEIDDWKAQWLQHVDKYPPPATNFANIRQLSSRFQRTPALFIFGREDKNSQTQFRRRELRWFKSPKVQVVEVPGSGEFLFENGGVQLMKRILDKK